MREAKQDQSLWQGARIQRSLPRALVLFSCSHDFVDGLVMDELGVTEAIYPGSCALGLSSYTKDLQQSVCSSSNSLLKILLVPQSQQMQTNHMAHGATPGSSELFQFVY